MPWTQLLACTLQASTSHCGQCILVCYRFCWGSDCTCAAQLHVPIMLQKVLRLCSNLPLFGHYQADKCRAACHHVTRHVPAGGELVAHDRWADRPAAGDMGGYPARARQQRRPRPLRRPRWLEQPGPAGGESSWPLTAPPAVLLDHFKFKSSLSCQHLPGIFIVGKCMSTLTRV